MWDVSACLLGLIASNKLMRSECRPARARLGWGNLGRQGICSTSVAAAERKYVRNRRDLAGDDRLNLTSHAVLCVVFVSPMLSLVGPVAGITEDE